MAILTISREYGSGAGTWGKALAGRLGYEYIDRARILADMKVLGKQWEKYDEEYNRNYPTVWERYDRSFQGYIALTQSLILDYGLQDKVILMGRGGNFLYKGISHALRVRAVMPMTERIKRVTGKQEVSQDTAQWLIDKVDNEMARAVYLIYGKKWDNPAEYDLVLDLHSGTEEALIRIVTDLLQQKEKANTAEGRQALRLRAAAAKVKAGIVADPQFLVPTLDVEVVGDKLVLRGVIHNPKEHQKIEEEAKKLAGTIPIKCELHYRGLTGR